MKTVNSIKNRIIIASATFATAAVVSFGSYACGDSVAITAEADSIEMAAPITSMAAVDSLSLMGDDFKKVANCKIRNIHISIAPPSFKQSLELNLAAVN